MNTEQEVLRARRKKYYLLSTRPISILPGPIHRLFTIVPGLQQDSPCKLFSSHTNTTFANPSYNEVVKSLRTFLVILILVREERA